MTLCKTVVTSLLMQWSYHSLWNSVKKSCRSSWLESQILNIKLKKKQQKVPGSPSKLLASDWRTCGNFQPCCLVLSHWHVLFHNLAEGCGNSTTYDNMDMFHLHLPCWRDGWRWRCRRARCEHHPRHSGPRCYWCDDPTGSERVGIAHWNSGHEAIWNN